MRRNIFIGLTCLLLIVSSTLMAGDIVVIVNKNVNEESILRKDVRKIFLGQKSRWKSGDKIIPVTLKSGDVHDAFLEKCVGKSLSAYTSFWKQAIFTGKGTPPESFKTEAELIKFVVSKPGAIGYVSSTTKIDSVKVLPVK